jgi:hypothetical protein
MIARAVSPITRKEAARRAAAPAVTRPGLTSAALSTLTPNEEISPKTIVSRSARP